MNAQHNQENKLGLRAKNQEGQEWILLGDDMMLSYNMDVTKNVQMAMAAVQASVNEVYDAYSNPTKWSSKIGSNGKEAGDKANEEANADGNNFPFGLGPSVFGALNRFPLPLDNFSCKKTTTSEACVPRQVQVSKKTMGSDKCFNVDCAGKTGASCDAAKDGGTPCCERVKKYVSVGLNEQPNDERSCTTGKGSGSGKCSADSDCEKWRGDTKCVAGECLCTGNFISLNGFCTRLPAHGPQLIRPATESVNVKRKGKSRTVKMSQLKIGDELSGRTIMSGGNAKVTTAPSEHTTFECKDTAKLNPPPMFIDGAVAGLPGTLLTRYGDFLRGKGYKRYNGAYQLIDLSDSTYGLEMLEKSYKDNFIFSANPVGGQASKITPPPKSIKTRPAVWQQADMSKEDQNAWKKLIGKQSTSATYITGGGMEATGLCKRSTTFSCGGDSDCYPDPNNPCQGTCVCETQGVNECKCAAAGYVGENAIYKISYNLKKQTVPPCHKQTGGTCSWWSSCDSSRNAVCENEKCVCPTGKTAVGGKCETSNCS